MVTRKLIPWSGTGRAMGVDPFTALDRIVGGFLGGLEGGKQAGISPMLGSGFSPSLEVEETRDSFLIHTELPGLSRDDFDVSVEEDVLTIEGEKTVIRSSSEGTDEDADKDEGGHHYSERSYGHFTRRLRLPENVDASAIKASMENGVLTLTLPKVEEPEPEKRTIDIDVR